MPDLINGPFVEATKAWVSALQRAQAFKNKRFATEAAEGLRFFAGPYDFFFNKIRSDKFFRTNDSPATESDIVVTINKVAELVQIFGPVLYQKNPDRRATIPEPPKINPQIFAQDPLRFMASQQAYQMAGQQMLVHQAIASLFESIENITPHLLDLKTNSRRAIDEALIKGLGLLWHDVITDPVTGTRACGSFWRTVDDFLMDPKAHSIDAITWCARRTTMPRWQAERQYRLPAGTLKAASHCLDGLEQNFVPPDEGDRCEVWEIWSKIGCGGRLPGNEHITDIQKAAYEAMGDYCYLCIIPNHPWPVNLPPGIFRQENAWQTAQQLLQWPTPYWIDRAWPFTPIYFHEVPKDPWPLSHLTPGMGELKFLNWAYAKLASKIKTTCRDLIAIDASASDELVEIIKNGPDLTVFKTIGMDGKQGIQEFVNWLQHPTWNPDIWKVLAAISEQFDLRVGLTELMYGLSSKQMRSANESEKKYEAVNVRPDDMADKVQDSMGRAAEREKLANYWNLRPEDVEFYLGPVGQMAWQMFVYGQDPRQVMAVKMRIEADSTQKPNKGQLVDDINQAMQMLLQPLFQVAGMGQVGLFNALVQAWADSIGLRDGHRFTIQPLPPPMPMGAPGEPAGAGAPPAA